jgi:hypothetical protein
MRTTLDPFRNKLLDHFLKSACYEAQRPVFSQWVLAVATSRGGPTNVTRCDGRTEAAHFAHEFQLTDRSVALSGGESVVVKRWNCHDGISADRNNLLNQEFRYAHSCWNHMVIRL